MYIIDVEESLAESAQILAEADNLIESAATEGEVESADIDAHNVSEIEAVQNNTAVESTPAELSVQSLEQQETQTTDQAVSEKLQLSDY